MQFDKDLYDYLEVQEVAQEFYDMLEVDELFSEDDNIEEYNHLRQFGIHEYLEEAF